MPRRRLPLVGAVIAVVVLITASLWAIGTRDLASAPGTLEAAAGGAASDAAEDGALIGAIPPRVEADDGATTGSEADLALPYSVLIASYSSYEDARARQRDWARTGVPFFVAPTVVRGVVYYRVFAGMLSDRGEAVELMRSLVDRGIKEAERDWDVRPVRLAYDFGAFGDRDGARAAVARLIEGGVPAYAVRIGGGPAAGTGYRVYAGGYERPEDAVPLERQIARSDLSAELVERVGRNRP